MPRTQTWKERLSLTVDVVMLVLIVSNLTLLIFDWGFENPTFQDFLQQWIPGFYFWYASTIHEHFFFVDLMFVSVFIVEILIRWGLAIYRGRYHRWFFYPFVHWYDVLGCIPVSSLRSLRLLRIIAMVPKMQRLGVVDFRKTALYRTFSKYGGIVVEELSDRVAVRILDGIKDEVRDGHPVLDQVTKQVIEPQRDLLIQSMTHRLQEATAKAYGTYQSDFREYVEDVIAEAVDRNQEIRTIAAIPGVGRTMASLLERAISDIVFNVIDQMMADVASVENDKVINQITSISTDAILSSEYDQRLNRLTRTILLQSIDLIKEHVEIQQWKLEGREVPRPDRSVERTVPQNNGTINNNT
ncbi:hypothetical protein CRI94_07895 [Longibacter salinarum]|uniref:Preprotein translocase subunit SecA n=1 Tax=Longibacter salinarum TaxID=1850348 RepID=A0A2A8CZ97_9BACT|nr:hypothetical protein [Longibacter salinarum]PEN13966.1 hypothetical protein CRI94_07895 [Longibacter salinarum]